MALPCGAVGAVPWSDQANAIAVFLPARAAIDRKALGGVVKPVQALAGSITLALVIFALAAGASVAGPAHDFSLAGTYTQNTPCKGDGSDPSDRQVKISPPKIYSKAGICTFVQTKREGSAIEAQVECHFPSGPLVGDVIFTMQNDDTINFTDRDQNYSSVLYRCPE